MIRFGACVARRLLGGGVVVALEFWIDVQVHWLRKPPDRRRHHAVHDGPQLRLGVLLFDDLAEVEDLLRGRVVARMVGATVCRCAGSVSRGRNAVGFDGVDGHVILVVRSDRTLPLIALRANAQA